MRRSTLVIVALTVCAILAVAASTQTGGGPAHMSRYLLAQVGEALGMQASVSPNPINAAAKALKEKELALIDREQLVTAAEERLAHAARDRSRTLVFVYVAGGILLALIAVNYGLDIRRARTIASETPPSVEAPFHV